MLNSENTDIPENATNLADKETETEFSGVSTQRALALHAIKENRVFHCAQARAFIVDGSKGDKYTVTLHPEKCVCAALGTCWHIIAAKLSIGLDDVDEKKIYNLTQLNRNVRKKPNKNAGKKRPRPIDKKDEENIVVPAPDSKTNDIKTTPFNDTGDNFITSTLLKCPNLNTNLSPVSKRPKVTNLSIIKEETSLSCENDEVSEYITNTSPTFIKRRKTRLSLPNCKTLPEEINETINVPSIRETIKEPESDTWISYGNDRLNNDHRNVVINEGKLCSDIINFSQSIIKDQYNMVGLQNTGKVPVYKENKKWEYALSFKSIESHIAAQIHHTGKDHWVLSVTNDGSVYLIDSSLSKINAVTASMEIQLAQLYGKDKITIPAVQQQDNPVDCGIFSIAFLVEFCQNGINSLPRVVFDIRKMREHLVMCLEKQFFTPFPKLFIRNKNKTKKPMAYFLELDCSGCTLPNIFDDMIGCENDACGKWYHLRCTNLNKSVSNSMKFFCDECEPT